MENISNSFWLMIYMCGILHTVSTSMAYDGRECLSSLCLVIKAFSGARKGERVFPRPGRWILHRAFSPIREIVLVNTRDCTM
ncbi:hypothetical protein L1987_47489 [Smallanthus sonchifolius]|uniref:Uncharacterized protein n=1 Tax=Smallanthus sonchifolius TaxID=185202 RepID=A0ACB9G3B9_9ASTR|nr:hypothetical protein L1987_47489 [Smallanthus sonchifolius]